MQNIARDDVPRTRFLGTVFDQIDMDGALRLAHAAMRDRRRLQHSDVNVAKIVQMKDDPDLRRYVAASDLVCVDGMGVVWGAGLLGVPVAGRVTGVDLMMRTLDLCAREGFRPFFFGARQSVLEDMLARLAESHPTLAVAGIRNGYFTPEEEPGIVEEIRASGADCLFVGITSPIKERFLHDHRDALGVPFQIGVGGAFDVVSGNVPRAPALVQRIGMEWLFRVLQEPRRLFRRYLTTNSRYAGLLLAEMLRRLAGAGDRDRDDRNGQGSRS
jgi:N-acetylglucosaminyldiphosphoundecaprenol N-acetyl-beta-D-mannosaminyltransferase